MACKYCILAHANGEDCYNESLVVAPIKSNVGDLAIYVDIESDGSLTVYGKSGDADYVKIGHKKIKYCPFCGKPISQNTQTRKK